MKSLELKIPPPLWMLLTGLIMYGLARLLPVLSWPWPGRGWIAGLLVGAGVLCGVLGVLSFRRYRTTVHPQYPHLSTFLVTRGIYRLSRNPMYLGMLCLLLGWAVWLSNAAALLIGPPCFVLAITRWQIIPEERALKDLFGSTFVLYAEQVRRWL